MMYVRAGLFGLGALFALSAWASPALALAAGAALALTFGNPWPDLTATLGSRLLQVAVVALGLGISLDSLVRAGSAGVGLKIILILAVFVVGSPLCRWLFVDRCLSLLVTSGS